MAETKTRWNSGKNADPDFRRERAMAGVAARNSLENHVRHVVGRAPELTDEQRERLAAILRPSTQDEVAS